MSVVKKLNSLPSPMDWQEIIAAQNPNSANVDWEHIILKGEYLQNQNFKSAVLRNAEFISCDLTGSTFEDAVLSRANFRNSKLDYVNFAEADLTKANFYETSLLGTMFIGSHLFGANFRESLMGKTTFTDTDLETCIGLESIVHKSSSSIGVECLYQAGANL